jgi:hypothetical protein
MKCVRATILIIIPKSILIDIDWEVVLFTIHI